MNGYPGQIPSFDWYGIVQDGSLEQGDFFFDCPTLEPIAPIVGEAGGEVEISTVVRNFDVVVLSQSCDLAQGKLETVLVCPHWPIALFEKIEARFHDRKMKEEIRRGNLPGYHMLAACDLGGFASQIRIASFRQVFGLPFDYVRNMASRPSSRLRLLPPYREHLAQAFARFIMRVGLPVDIPPFI